MVTVQEVAAHNTKESLWVIISGHVYDLTDFVDNHPGGKAIILKFAGKDATKKFVPLHAKDVLQKYLSPAQRLGPVTGAEDVQEEEDEDEKEHRRLMALRPPLSSMLNLFDFESVARKVMSKTGWAYYSSGADDEITLRDNHRAFQRIWFKPKVLVDVRKVDASTTMLGTKTALPVYITATALGKLADPEGEVALCRAAARCNVIQMIPTLASCSFDEIADARAPGQTQWMQLYVNEDRQRCKEIVQHAEARGITALFITVDAPSLGRREKDMRTKFDEDAADVQDGDGDGDNDEAAIDRSQGAARALSSFIDPGLSWKDIPWFRSITNMKLVLKGVQRADDVVRAVEYGLDGVVLSNHGGRQVDTSRSGIEILEETVRELRARGLEDRIELFVDGGVRRATDVIKALCLGAKGVGVGRPVLYALASYSQAGVERMFDIVREEMEMNMRLLGATSVADFTPDLVQTDSLRAHDAMPEDRLASQTYESMQTPKFRAKI